MKQICPRSVMDNTAVFGTAYSSSSLDGGTTKSLYCKECELACNGEHDAAQKHEKVRNFGLFCCYFRGDVQLPSQIYLANAKKVVRLSYFDNRYIFYLSRTPTRTPYRKIFQCGGSIFDSQF